MFNVVKAFGSIFSTQGYSTANNMLIRNYVNTNFNYFNEEAVVMNRFTRIKQVASASKVAGGPHGAIAKSPSHQETPFMSSALTISLC